MKKTLKVLNISLIIKIMATLKPTVKSKLKTGMYIVYIRVVHNRQSSFIRTSWMVNDKGIKGKDTTPFLLARIKDITGGDSLDSNIQLVLNNARLAARTAALL